LQKSVDELRRRLEVLANSIPDEAAQARTELDDVTAQLNRLIDAVASGALDGSTIRSRVETLEARKASLNAKIAQLRSVQAAPLELPGHDWVSAELKQLAALLGQEMASLAPSLRPMLAQLVADEVRPPGRILGHSRLRVTLDSWAALKQILGSKLPAAVISTFTAGDGGTSEDFVFEFSRSTRAQKWGPIILRWRKQEMQWSEICKRTGLTLGTAYYFFKVWKNATAAM
jgi:hypothetical protein